MGLVAGHGYDQVRRNAVELEAVSAAMRMEVGAVFSYSRYSLQDSELSVAGRFALTHEWEDPASGHVCSLGVTPYAPLPFIRPQIELAIALAWIRKPDLHFNLHPIGEGGKVTDNLLFHNLRLIITIAPPRPML